MITKEYLQQELVKRIDGYKRGVETSTDNIVAEMKSILVLVNALPNYEKKYNEALARAKDVKNGPSPHDSSVATVKYIFPELRESDDERIRKFIYDYIADSYWRKDWNVSQEECIAYLEKQKEQKPAEWSKEDEKIMESLISLIETIGEYYISLETIDRYVAWLKSIRPSWKPSEEQMDALKELIDDANRAGWVTPGATELYENLKRL